VIIIEAGLSIKQDLMLMLSKYGPLEQQLHSKLVNSGFRVGIINARDEELRITQGRAVLLLDNVFEALIASGLFDKTLNAQNVYVMAMNRVLLFRELSRLGYPVPEFMIALNPNVVANVVKSIGRTYMATPSMAMELDGIVTTWEGSKSIAEHRMYMGNPLAKINLLMKAPDSMFNAQVIGTNCINCSGLDSMLLRLSRDIGCVLCTYAIGVYDSEAVILGLDPRIELTAENLDKVVSAIVRWYNGEW
jgi:hypothetical protein